MQQQQRRSGCGGCKQQQGEGGEGRARYFYPSAPSKEEPVEQKKEATKSIDERSRMYYPKDTMCDRTRRGTERVNIKK